MSQYIIRILTSSDLEWPGNIDPVTALFSYVLLVTHKLPRGGVIRAYRYSDANFSSRALPKRQAMSLIPCR